MTIFSFEQLNFIMIYYFDRFDYVTGPSTEQIIQLHVYNIVFIIN